MYLLCRNRKKFVQLPLNIFFVFKQMAAPRCIPMFLKGRVAASERHQCATASERKNVQLLLKQSGKRYIINCLHRVTNQKTVDLFWNIKIPKPQKHWLSIKHWLLCMRLAYFLGDCFFKITLMWSRCSFKQCIKSCSKCFYSHSILLWISKTYSVVQF